MNRFIHRWAPVALGFTLAACGNNDDADPKLSVDNLNEGAYTVSTGNADAPTVGRYLAAADGSRLLVVGDDNGVARNLYRRTGSGDWVAVPPVGQDTRISLLRQDPLVVATPTLASVAGHYVTTSPPEGAASFSITTDGRIVADATSACRLTGTLGTGVLPGTLKLELATSGCGELPTSSTGVLSVDPDLAPASFRLIADDRSKVIDLRAFAE